MHAGHQDVNYHSKRYLVDTFERLGYRYRGDLTEQHMRLKSWPRHPWYDHNMVGVLERWTPLVGDACNSKSDEEGAHMALLGSLES